MASTGRQAPHSHIFKFRSNAVHTRSQAVYIRMAVTSGVLLPWHAGQHSAGLHASWSTSPASASLTAAVQVVAAVPTGVALALMHAALQPAPRVQDVLPLLGSMHMPARLRTLALQACVSSEENAFEATVHLAREAQSISDTLPLLTGLTAVKLDLVDVIPIASRCCLSGRLTDGDIERAVQAAFSPRHLQSLDITLRDLRGDGAFTSSDTGASRSSAPMRAMAAGLARSSEVKRLRLRMDECSDSAAAADLAQHICTLPSLTSLQLSGAGLTQRLLGPLATCMTALTALREVDVSDVALPHAHTLAHIMSRLTAVSSLGIVCMSGMHDGNGAATAEAAADLSGQVVAAIAAAPHLRALHLGATAPYGVSDTPSLDPPTWADIGAAMTVNASALARLTRLALVNCVRCVDVGGLARALASMPHLQALEVSVPGHASCGVLRRGRRSRCIIAMCCLFVGLTELSRLTTLALTGFCLHAPPRPAAQFVASIVRLPALHKLALVNHQPHTGTGSHWWPIAVPLAGAMGSTTWFTALRELHLQGTEVPSYELKLIAASLSGLTTLTSLHFSCVDDSSQPDFMLELEKSLSRLSDLRRLFLGQLNFGLAALGAALEASSLLCTSFPT